MNDFERYLRQVAASPACGLGCIIVPTDVDRATFIARCYSTETVSIEGQFGGMSFNNVPITREALQYIEFPGEKEVYGSLVVFLFHPKTAKPIIVGVLSKKRELYGVDWKQFKRFKTEAGNLVSVVGDGKKGNLYVTVVGTENDSGGQILINVQEPSNKGVLKVSVQGDIQFINQNFTMNCLTTKIVSKTSIEAETDDLTVTAQKKIVLSAEDKVSIGKENYEKAVLGDTLKDDIISPLLSALKTDLRVSTAMGPSGPPLPNFVAKIAQIEAKLNNILSQKVEIE